MHASDRVLIAGQSGSGKTYLARRMTSGLRRLVVFDTKGTLDQWALDFWNPKTAKRLADGKPVRARVAYDPEDPELNERVMWECYRAGGVTVYCDELYGMTEEGRKVPPILTALYTRGRELGVGVWAAMQRVYRVPVVALTEPTRAFVFRLIGEQDRKRIAEMYGEEMGQPIPMTDPHGFRFWSPETGAIYCRSI